ncbi:CxxC-x17-CxxC domain-containing protein [Granulicella sibirica]|uniref:CxxC-x17-CxxC domain-containing protein n=1 Tax=Granulicella sibirica TaxID=2479048 RepID=UPI001F4F7C61|nr:CxxC-x17-CxxC domain-containing protein [Granulicella sibirica]
MVAEAAGKGTGPAAAGISRTETRTMCSDCGIETTVPFKPTQGRPVLCRQCFQTKRGPAVQGVATPAAATMQATAELVAAASNVAALERSPSIVEMASVAAPQA